MTAARRVLVVSHGFQAHYELGFCNGLAENGIEVLLLGSDTTLTARLHAGVRFVNLRGSQDPRRGRWRKLLDMARYHLRLLTTVISNAGSPIVVIGLLSPEWPVGVAEGTILRAFSRSLALVVHNILPHNRHTSAMRRVYSVIYRIPHVLLVHTESTRSELKRQFNVPDHRVVVVAHGMNDAIVLSDQPKALAKTELGLAADDRTVLFFGLASRYKGIDLVLDALDDHPRIKLLIAGLCLPDEFGQEVRRRMKDVVASGRAIWFDGYVDDATAGKFFSAADVTLLPYRHIDQSGILLLSLGLGVPVLAAASGGLLDLVATSNGRFFPSIDARGVSVGLKAFFLDGAPRFERDAVRATVAHLAWRRTLAPYVRYLATGNSSRIDGARSVEQEES
jgi:glycosyltransferase involved in cell wall biosynthesis